MDSEETNDAPRECGEPKRERPLARWLARYWWTIQIGLLIATIALACAIWFDTADWAETAAVVIWLLFFPLGAASLILLIVNRKWGAFLLSLAVSGVMAIASVSVIGVLYFADAVRSMGTEEVDDFAAKHPIPEGLEYSIPLGHLMPDGTEMDMEWPKRSTPVEPDIDRTDRESWLQIWNSYQGGIYCYDFYYPALPEGTIYLKCYEAGKNKRLSADWLGKDTSVPHKATKSFSKLVDRQQFTIYEGDWGEYYAVRVEVWHKDKRTHKDTKLMEKTYRMEGWMR